MDELIQLEEKVNRLIATVNELKQKLQVLVRENEDLRNREAEAKKKVDGLIEKVDNLLI